MNLILLNPNEPDQSFPPVEQALTEPEGLLAVGGCLSLPRLVNAYRKGIFPWYNPGEPILWWSPNPRLVLYPEQLYISRSLQKTIRRQSFKVTFDTAFAEVIECCALPRSEETGTWICEDIKQAYQALYRLGLAHSVEAWQAGELVGGLYGVSLGQVFFGESMFHHCTDASKVAFVYLIQQLRQWNYQLIDCQVHTTHLCSLGAVEMARKDFVKLLDRYCELPPHALAWLK